MGDGHIRCLKIYLAVLIFVGILMFGRISSYISDGSTIHKNKETFKVEKKSYHKQLKCIKTSNELRDFACA